MASFDACQSQLREHAQHLNHDVVDDIENDDGTVTGFVCETSGYTYFAEGWNPRKVFSVNFHFSLVNTLADALEEDRARQYASGDTDEVDDVRRLAAIELLENMSAQRHQEFSYHLTEQLTTTDVAFTYDTTESGRITGFTINRRLFPDEDSYDLTEYNHSVQTVINTGNRAMNFVMQAFDVEAIMGEHEAREEPENLRYIG